MYILHDAVIYKRLAIYTETSS